MLIRNPDILSTAFESGGAVLFNISDRRAYLLNKTAWQIFLLSDGENTAEDTAAIIAEMYGTDKETLRNDMEKILTQFVKKGILLHEKR